MDNFMVNLQNAVAAARTETFNKSDQLSLGEIIAKCEAIAAIGYRSHDGSEPSVVYDFEYLYPTDIDSWRGSYAELALNFESDGDKLSLSGFIQLLKSAVGKTFFGYKGGEYVMSRHTPVWVANYGNGGSTAIIDVINDDYQVILITARRKF